MGIFKLRGQTRPTEPIAEVDKERLQEIFSRCLVQSGNHQDNLTEIMRLLMICLDHEFKEDNQATLLYFLLEQTNVAAKDVYPTAKFDSIVKELIEKQNRG